MDNSLFNDKIQIFRDVIRLAENKANASNSSENRGASPLDITGILDSPAGKRNKALKKELSDYLESLSFDDVKMLQTVMYLGRDKDYNESLTPNVIYKNELEYFNRQGWNSKDIEISQITQKSPLADYLKSGLDILEVSI